MSQRRPQSGPGPIGRYLAYRIPATIRETRLAIGWTQRALAAKANTSQATLSRVEAGQIDRADLATIGRVLDALQVRLEIRVDAPFLADRRPQRDAAHAYCVAFIARRLMPSGWNVRREVEIQGGRSHGWIDVLAYRQGDHALLVIEMKTEIEDLRQIERSMRWYVREAPRGGTAPRLASTAVDRRVDRSRHAGDSRTSAPKSRRNRAGLSGSR
jgi:transcriptional regulator with XRE-family HTH domain